jgi:hypothetical protein
MSVPVKQVNAGGFGTTAENFENCLREAEP